MAGSCGSYKKKIAYLHSFPIIEPLHYTPLHPTNQSPILSGASMLSQWPHQQRRSSSILCARYARRHRQQGERINNTKNTNKNLFPPCIHSNDASTPVHPSASIKANETVRLLFGFMRWAELVTLLLLLLLWPCAATTPHVLMASFRAVHITTTSDRLAMMAKSRVIEKCNAK